MSAVDHAGPVAAPRPRGGWRWAAAGTVALPVLWTLLALVIGSFGLTAVGVVLQAVVLGAAVGVGVGQRWAYAAVALLGAVVLVDSVVDPGMLAAVGWVSGALYLAIGVALLAASRPPRQ